MIYFSLKFIILQSLSKKNRLCKIISLEAKINQNFCNKREARVYIRVKANIRDCCSS